MSCKDIENDELIRQHISDWKDLRDILVWNIKMEMQPQVIEYFKVRLESVKRLLGSHAEEK